MVATVHRVLLEVPQAVVHPAHVPLHAEAEAAVLGGPRHHRPGGRLLGDGLHVGEVGVDRLVELLQEAERAEVLVAAVLVGDPLPRLAGVVEVEHRRHGIHPDPVDVVAVEPEVGAREQEAPDLEAVVVEDRAVPVRVVALARVGVLVEVGAVEVAEAVLVAREVRGHPVEDHTDAGLVQRVDQEHQVLGRAEPGRGGEVAGGLVAPGAVERVLGERQELHVGEPLLEHVVAQHGGELAVVQRPQLVLGVAPRPEVHLVHRHGGVEGVAGAPLGHPVAVAPLVAVERPHHRRRARAASRTRTPSGRPCRRRSRWPVIRCGTCSGRRGRCRARSRSRCRSRPERRGGRRPASSGCRRTGPRPRVRSGPRRRTNSPRSRRRRCRDGHRAARRGVCGRLR